MLAINNVNQPWLILLMSCLGLGNGKMIQTYFLNKHYDFLEPMCNSCPEIECLLTEKDYEIPNDFTICVRYSVMFMNRYHLMTISDGDPWPTMP